MRIPLRPLPRILDARAHGENDKLIERENLRLRREQARDLERRQAEWRLLFVALAFVAGFCVIGVRMGMLATSPVAEAAVYQGENIADERADILDRNGQILATNLVTNSLYAEMRYMLDPDRAARELVRIFPDMDYDWLAGQLLDPDRTFVWIRARLSPEQAQAVHDLGEPGLMLGPREMRLYPNGRLAAHILGGAGFGTQGVTAAEIIGTAGIELRMDRRLRDPDLADIPVNLSIDLTAQAIVETELQDGIDYLNARGGTAVVMNAHTGEILAMASAPDFDPNDRPAPPATGEASDHPIFNRAVQGVYEMGSVMKSFAIAQAMELGLVTPETIIETPTRREIGSVMVVDDHPHGARQSVADVLAYSSNVGTAQMAAMIGPERQRAFLDSFGFLSPLGLELSEAPGVTPQFDPNWRGPQTTTISFGYGLAITPVHLAAGYSTLVNGGYRVRPTLISRADPVRGDRLISQRTSDWMRALLRRVVTNGTASMGDAEGYGVGGKTGTANRLNRSGGGYDTSRTISTFASAFPINDPQYVVVVSMEEPQIEAMGEMRRSAGWTVVPVTAELVARLAPVLGLRPQTDAEIEQHLSLR